MAAVTYDPAKACGLDAALHALRDQPHGAFLPSPVGFGIGVFCLLQSRYRRV